MDAKTTCRILESLNSSMTEEQRLGLYYFLEERYRDSHFDFVRSILQYAVKYHTDLAAAAWPGTEKELSGYVSCPRDRGFVLDQDEVDELLRAWNTAVDDGDPV